MAKKNHSEAVTPVASVKRTPQEKAQHKAEKASRQASKDLTDDHVEKKASQKQILKTAAKQLQKELDVRMSEVVTRIRKETKAKLKEVVKEATRRLDVDTERMFEQALHTIVRHYDSIAPGRSSDLNFPAPTAADEKIIDAEQDKQDTSIAAPAPRQNHQKSKTLTKNGAPSKVHTATEATSRNRTERPASGSRKAPVAAPATSPSRRPGRPKRSGPASTAADTSTSEATTNDSVAVDNA